MAQDREQHESTNRWNDIDTPLVLTVGVVSAILIFGVIIPGVKALVYNAENTRTVQTGGGQVHPDLRTYLADEQAILEGQAGWVNKEQGVARITIDDAMELYVERQSNEQ